MSGNTRISRAQVSPNFLSMVNALQQHAKAELAAAENTGVKTWFVPGNFSDSLVDPATLTGPGSDSGGAFTRQDINNQYESVTQGYSSAGTIGDVISLKIQNDFVAAAERAWRIRHCTPARAAGLAVARDIGHGHGPLFSSDAGGIVAVASNFIAAGAGATQNSSG